MDPVTISAFPQLLQYGALGLCALILVAWFWSVVQFVKVMERALDVIPQLIVTVNDLQEKVETGNEISGTIRNRMLEWECPFRRPLQPAGAKEPASCATG